MALDPLTAIFDVGSKLIDRLWPDPETRDKAKLELLEMRQKGELAVLTADTELAKGQLEVNKIEAGHRTLFVSGWRPFIGWTCGLAFAYHTVIESIMERIALSRGETHTPLSFDMEALYPVMLGMLGLGVMRTAEKWKGVSK